MTLKPEQLKKKRTLDFIKVKTFLCFIGYYQESERQLKEWEKIFALLQKLP